MITKKIPAEIHRRINKMAHAVGIARATEARTALQERIREAHQAGADLVKLNQVLDAIASVGIV